MIKLKSKSLNTQNNSGRFESKLERAERDVLDKKNAINNVLNAKNEEPRVNRFAKKKPQLIEIEY